jgi:hypothetical protein
LCVVRCAALAAEGESTSTQVAACACRSAFHLAFGVRVSTLYARVTGSTVYVATVYVYAVYRVRSS